MKLKPLPTLIPVVLGIAVLTHPLILCAQQPPTRPTAKKITDIKKALEEAKKLERERAQRNNALQRDVGRGDVPSDRRPVVFPRNFPKPGSRDPNRPDEKTIAVLKALNERVTTKFEDSSLKEVVDYLSKRYKVAIALDPLAMRELGVEYDSKVSLNPRGVTLRTVLHKILGELEMTYYVQNGSINVTSVERAKAVKSVRVYPLAGLLPLMNPRLNGGLVGQRLNQIQRLQAANNLIQTIVSTVEPDSWAVNGGEGTIVYYPATSSLIVKQSAEVHLKLGNGSSLRP